MEKEGEEKRARVVEVRRYSLTRLYFHSRVWVVGVALVKRGCCQVELLFWCSIILLCGGMECEESESGGGEDWQISRNIIVILEYGD